MATIPDRALARTSADGYEMATLQGHGRPQQPPPPAAGQASSAGPSLPQFAEHDPHLGPQLAVPNDPEPIIIPPASPTPSAAHIAPDKADGCWAKRYSTKHPWGAAVIVLSFIIVFGLIIGVAVYARAHSSNNQGPSSTPSSNSTASVTTDNTSLMTATSSTPNPSGLPVPTECDKSQRITNVSYMGITDPNGAQWKYQLSAASDAGNCCAQCYQTFSHGCQAWAFLPWNGTHSPCNIIYQGRGQKPDTGCPDGHVFLLFSTSQNKDYATSEGGAGPCGTTATTTNSGGP